MELLKNIMITAFIAVFAENTIFSRALGTSTLIVVARNRKNLVGFGLSVTYITAVISVLTYFADKALNANETGYIYTPLVYIAILGAVYVITLLCLWRFAPVIFGRMKKYIHISAFNCAVLGSMFLISKYCVTLADYFIHGLGIGLGFVLAVYLTAIVYDRIYSEKAPYAFRGYPLMLIYIGILSMAFWGLSGHTLNY
ncbi:MAG: Rnf-Nqr domain containing protein [Oscillospiraceae bacterium]